MEQEIDYYEIEKTDRLCPLLSIVEMKQFGHLFYCVGKKCMWWEKCSEERRKDGFRCIYAN